MTETNGQTTELTTETPELKPKPKRSPKRQGGTGIPPRQNESDADFQRRVTAECRADVALLPESPEQLIEKYPHLGFLRPTWARFVVAYVETGHGTKAARIAGFAPSTCAKRAHELLKRQDVRTAIARTRVVREDTALDDDRVINGLLREATDTGTGSSQSARVMAWTRLGEAMGLFKRPDLNAFEGLKEIRITLVLPDGTTTQVGGRAVRKDSPRA